MENKNMTYKNCVWYMADIDRCKLPGVNEKHITCMAQEKGEMNDFCMWITEFLSFKVEKELDEPKEVQLELFDLNDQLGFGDANELAPESYLNNLFERAYEYLKSEKEVKNEL